MTTSIDTITPGAVITFRSKNVNDTVVWRGTLESKGTYRSILPYGDPRAYNEAVRQNDPSVTSDVTLLSYFLITVDNSGTTPTVQAFAQEWIEDGSLNEITVGNKVKLIVDDELSNPQRILSILANAGYSAKIL